MLSFLAVFPDPFTEIGFIPFKEIKAKQSPPTPVEFGSMTACTAEAAIAASIAFPPFFRIDIASNVLSGCEVAAIAFKPITLDLPGI